MTEIQNAFGKSVRASNRDNYAIYKVNDSHTITCENGCFVLMSTLYQCFFLIREKTDERLLFEDE